ncbi:putative nucleotidyltransferase substrate binding domain-containing protein [Teredinibacter sp. KSP-S5-2]|uniref:putative nucleotidyltransferase substrate binding domain-containing protein n=1 Tax=Teredinibacter sp. KSP-S5-2 TaxID=3034506 RepID=UPI0029346C64|nr:putative nucleotidyltransferase substrate binding domain-containing protein [Teredinibacter sp. KSP-S5-2]WNO09657.1 putative nucleotidyltransferase substrate binding domain-containing protein [Teredinibacter sp. KSP-S5-2]
MSNQVSEQVLDFLQVTAPFNLLTIEALDKLCKNISVIYVTQQNANKLIDLHRPGVFLIRSGEFLLTEHDFHTPLSEKDLFGYREVISGKRKSLTIKTEKEGLIYCIHRERFEQLCQENQPFYAYFSKLIHERLHEYSEHSLGRSWLHRKVSHVCQRPPVSCEKNISIAQAATIMAEQDVSSLLVTDEQRITGILTDKDLRSRVLAQRLNLDNPVCMVMTPSPTTLSEHKSIMEALVLMGKENIHHLPIVSKHDMKPIGIISATDLFRLQKNNLLYFMGEINKARNVEDLIKTCKKIPSYLSHYAKKLGDFDIASHFLSQVSDHVSHTLFDFFTAQYGAPSMRFAWISFGSFARNEALLDSVQSNALLIERTPSEAEEHYFNKLTQFICESLNQCGFRYCSQKVVASNKAFQFTPNSLKELYRSWISKPKGNGLVIARTILDSRFIFGDEALFSESQKARATLINNLSFLTKLAKSTRKHKIPLGLFNNFILKKTPNYKDGINIKLGGITILNNIARVISLENHCSGQSTTERLLLQNKASLFIDLDRESLAEMWRFLNRLRWRNQLGEYNNSDIISLATLSPIEQQQLKNCLKAIQQAHEYITTKLKQERLEVLL